MPPNAPLPVVCIQCQAQLSPEEVVPAQIPGLEVFRCRPCAGLSQGAAPSIAGPVGAQAQVKLARLLGYLSEHELGFQCLLRGPESELVFSDGGLTQFGDV